MTETIINLETVNPIEFFGVNNGKLDLLKKKFPLLKILSRGTQIKLSGAPEQIENAKEKIELLVQYLERNGHVSENYFEQILGGDDAEAVLRRMHVLPASALRRRESCSRETARTWPGSESVSTAWQVQRGLPQSDDAAQHTPATVAASTHVIAR